MCNNIPILATRIGIIHHGNQDGKMFYIKFEIYEMIKQLSSVESILYTYESGINYIFICVNFQYIRVA